jgi:hypothetical protein
LNRDPIEEKGGFNLYGFVYNSPMYSYDVLGQYVQAPVVPPRVIRPLPIYRPPAPVARFALRCGAAGATAVGGYWVGSKLDEELGISDIVSDAIIDVVEGEKYFGVTSRHSTYELDF